MASSTLQIKPIRNVGWGYNDEDLLEQLNGFRGRRIVVPINSFGGSVMEGTAIYNILLGRTEDVEARIIGYAMSMGSAISQAADTVRMPENGYFMIHNPWTVAIGDSRDMDQAGQLLEMMAGDLAKMYVRKTNLPLDDVRDMMNEETWLNGERALALGFIDELTEGVKLEASFTKDQYDKLKNIPDALVRPSKIYVMSLKDSLIEAINGVFNSARDKTETADDNTEVVETQEGDTGLETDQPLEDEVQETIEETEADESENAWEEGEQIEEEAEASQGNESDLVAGVRSAVAEGLVDLQKHIDQRLTAQMLKMNDLEDTCAALQNRVDTLAEKNAGSKGLKGDGTTGKTPRMSETEAAFAKKYHATRPGNETKVKAKG